MRPNTIISHIIIARLFLITAVLRKTFVPLMQSNPTGRTVDALVTLNTSQWLYFFSENFRDDKIILYIGKYQMIPRYIKLNSQSTLKLLNYKFVLTFFTA